MGWPGGLASPEDWSQARKALERVIQLSPKLAPAHNQLSRVYAHLGLNSEAKQEAQQTRAGGCAMQRSAQHSAQACHELPTATCCNPVP
ncbi:MAG: tetratricopeptide repeat protein [Terracidiphilus sp.]